MEFVVVDVTINRSSKVGHSIIDWWAFENSKSSLRKLRSNLYAMGPRKKMGEEGAAGLLKSFYLEEENRSRRLRRLIGFLEKC